MLNMEIYLKYLMLRGLLTPCSNKCIYNLHHGEILSFVLPIRLVADTSTNGRVQTNFSFKKTVAGRYFIKALLLRRFANPCTTRHKTI